MERKQNNTREKQNVKETEQYKRDSRMSRNTTIQERERQQNAKETEQYNRDNTRFVERQELAAFKFIMSKQCGHVGI
ncbi:unnamed protein product, partial [Sphagnum jensenii]